MTVLVGLVVLAVSVGFLVARRDADRRSISRPWTRSEISEDRRTLTLWVEKPGDPNCEVFDHIEVSLSEQTATAAAIYRRTDQEFCITPCALQDEPQTITLEEPLTDVTIAHASASRSCR
jgi:hypothetical protein